MLFTVLALTNRSNPTLPWGRYRLALAMTLCSLSLWFSLLPDDSKQALQSENWKDISQSLEGEFFF